MLYRYNQVVFHIINPKHIIRVFALINLHCFLSSQSLQEIQELRKEFENIRKQNNSSSMSDFNQTDDTVLSPSIIDLELQPNQNLIESDKNYFGYDFFLKRDFLQIWDNLPVPKNYILGPGDEIVVSLWGETQLRRSYIISRNGTIYDERVGLLNLNGKSLDSAFYFLKNKFGQIYSTLNEKNPSTFLDISLGDLQSININLVGQVNNPGLYTMHPFSNVITGLVQSGGINTNGSLRNIQIKRRGEISDIIDLYDYLINGNIYGNMQLRDQDVIIVMPRKNMVELDSAVTNPGIYESKDGETIYDMIQFAGGPNPFSSNYVGIKKLESLNDSVAYVELDSTKNILVENGDLITIKSKFRSVAEVHILGKVKIPGKYNFRNNMMLSDLLDMAGGFEDTTFWKSVYQTKAEIIRRDQNSRYEKIINFSPKGIINSIDKDIKLQNLDKVIIHENLNFIEKEPVFINGEVNVPGTYPLINDDESLYSVINRAGGLTSNALVNGIVIMRKQINYTSGLLENLNNSENNTVNDARFRVAWTNNQIPLMAGDSILVLKRTGTVKVLGEVYNPGFVEYQKGKSLKSYINEAGGLNNDGDSKSITVSYANGLVYPVKYNSFFKPSITDGSTIYVNEKPQQEPFNLTQFATNWTSIISSMITVILISQQLK